MYREPEDWVLYIERAKSNRLVNGITLGLGDDLVRRSEELKLFVIRPKKRMK